MEFTSRRYCNASETSWKLLHEDVTMYEKHHGIYRKKIIQRVRNILDLTSRRCYNVSGTSRILDPTSKKCYNVSGTSWTLHQADFTTCQDRLGSYLKKMLQRIMMLHHVLTAMTRCFLETLSEFLTINSGAGTSEARTQAQARPQPTRFSER